jgi:hypothetical protein
VAGSNAIICDSNNPSDSPRKQQLEKMTKDLFLTFHCYCTRKDASFESLTLYPFGGSRKPHISYIFTIQNCLIFVTFSQIHCLDVILEDTDIAKALTEYVSYAAIETLVLGAPAKHGFMR